MDSKAMLLEIEECQRTGFAQSVDSATTGSSVIAMRVPIEGSGQPLAVGMGVHSWQRKELLQETIHTHFQAISSVGESARVQVAQEGYAVFKTTQSAD